MERSLIYNSIQQTYTEQLLSAGSTEINKFSPYFLKKTCIQEVETEAKNFSGIFFLL